MTLDELLAAGERLDPRATAQARRVGRLRDFVATTWAEVQQAPHRAGSLLSARLRAARHLHSRERRLAADGLYGLLRHDRLLARATGSGDAIALWNAWIAWQSHELDLAAVAREAIVGLDEDEALALLANGSVATAAAIRRAFGEASLEFLAASNQRAPTVLRAQGTSVERLLAELAEADVDAEATSWSPWGVELYTRCNVQALAPWKAGRCEVQDEGSQLVARMVTQGPVVDLCAGAGGKSLALAARGMGVVACDIRTRALDEARKRAKRAGLRFETRRLDPEGPLPPDLRGAATVLVDAPCTGSGVWRRHPENRGVAERLPDLPALQLELLERAADLLDPGGQLIYATCSVFVEENEDVVAALLERRGDLRLEPLASAFGHDARRLGGEVLRVAPHTHGTDGFFGAILVRV